MSSNKRLRRHIRPKPKDRGGMCIVRRADVLAVLGDLDSAEEALGESQEIVADLKAEVERLQALVRVWSHPLPIPPRPYTYPYQPVTPWGSSITVNN